MPPEITASHTVTPPLVSQTQQPTSTDADVRLSQAQTDYADLRTNVTQGYKALGAKVSGMTRSLRSESKILGSKALFTLVSTVAGGIEHLCRLEAGRLTNKLVSNTQLARSLTEQNKAVQDLAKHTGILSQQLYDVRNPEMLTPLERATLLEQLDKVSESLLKFQDTINYDYAGSEEREAHLLGLNNVANEIHVSLNHYRTSIDTDNCLPDASMVVEEPAMESGSGKELLQELNDLARKNEDLAVRTPPDKSKEASLGCPSVMKLVNKLNKASFSVNGKSTSFYSLCRKDVQTPSHVGYQSQKDYHQLPEQAREIASALENSPELNKWAMEGGELLYQTAQALERYTNGEEPFPNKAALKDLQKQVNLFAGRSLQVNVTAPTTQPSEVPPIQSQEESSPVPGQERTPESLLSELPLPPPIQSQEEPSPVPDQERASESLLSEVPPVSVQERPLAGTTPLAPGPDVLTPRPQTKPGHEQLTPGKPSGDNPKFYLEEQSARQCVKHSLNALIGGPVLSTQDLVDIHRERLVSNLEVEVEAMPAARFEDNYGYLVSSAEREQCLQEGGARRLAEVLQVKLGKVEGMQDFFDPERAALRGGLIKYGMEALNHKREALALPEASYTQFGGRKEDEQAALDFVRNVQNTSDRFVIGAGEHYFAFRQAQNGKWYQVDSIDGQSEVPSPLAFMERRLQFENTDTPEARGDRYGGPRFEFVTFPTSVEPRFSNPLPSGVGPAGVA